METIPHHTDSCPKAVAGCSRVTTPTEDRNIDILVWYQDEILEPIERLYTAAVGPTFILMDDNARPHTVAIVNDYPEYGMANIFARS